MSYVVRDREATLKDIRGFIPGAPDLAVEVRSRDNTLADLAVKATEYVASGARLVWIVDPRARRVEVLRPGRPAETRSECDLLEGEPVLPGFSLPVSRLFAELE